MKKSTKVLLGVCLGVILLALIVLGIVFYEASNKVFTSEANQEIINNRKEEAAKKDALNNIIKNFDVTLKDSFPEGEYQTPVFATYKTVELDENSEILGRFTYTLTSGKQGDIYLVRSNSALINGNQQKLTLAVIYGGTPGTENFEIIDFVVVDSDDNDYYNTFVNPNNKKSYQELVASNSRKGKWISEDYLISNDYLESYTNVSGASFTTKALVNALKDARTQVYADYDLKAPEPDQIVKILSCEQTPNANLEITYSIKFKSNITSKQVIEVKATYDESTNAFTITDSSILLSDQEKDLIKANLVLPTYCVLSVSDSTYHVRTTNSFGAVITLVIKVEGKAIKEVSIVEGSSADSRDSFDVSQMIENITNKGSVDQFNEITLVSGSTVTSNAIISLLETVNIWIDGGIR